jgi:hypothetical protein
MRMNSTCFRTPAIAVVAALVLTGCGRQSRGNADAEQHRAATPAEGGATSTKGSAGEAKNFGDTRKKKAVDGTTQSASPSGLSKDVVPGESPPVTPAAPSNPSEKK